MALRHPSFCRNTLRVCSIAWILATLFLGVPCLVTALHQSNVCQAELAIVRIGGTYSERSSGLPMRWFGWADIHTATIAGVVSTNLDRDLSSMLRRVDIERLYLRGSSVSDFGLEDLTSHHTSVLDLSSTDITSHAIGFLPNLEIKSLDLSKTKIDDRALEKLRGFVAIEDLLLSSTKISNVGIKYLVGLKHLELLNLDDTGVDGCSFEDISKLKSLKSLSLDGLAISDDDLRHLAELHDLVSLSLCRTQISGSGFIFLSTLRHLEQLYADDTQLGIKCIPDLKRLTSLQSLHICGTPLAAHSIDETISQLPKVRITSIRELTEETK